MFAGIRMKVFFQFLLMAGLLLTASAGFAEHPALQQFRDKGGRVEFLGNAYNLDGWLVTNPKGGKQYVYTNSDGALLIGMLFAPDGTLETARQAEAFRQKTNPDAAAVQPEPATPTKSERLFAETEKSAWVAFGDKAAPYLYVFVNVSCDHCRDFWKDLEDSVKAGVFQARLVPYGVTDENREGAAALLSVEHPEEAWRAYIAGDKSALAKEKATKEAYLKVDENTAIVKNWHLPTPPFSLYRRPADGAVTAIAGRPENKLLLPAEFLR